MPFAVGVGGSSMAAPPMKPTTIYLGLAAFFALFAFFTIRLNPEGLNLLEKIGLYVFGLLSGVNIGLCLGARGRPGPNRVESTG